MTQSPTPPLTLSQRWMIVLLLVGYAVIGHFNRIGISVAGAEVFIEEKSGNGESPAEPSSPTKTPFFRVFQDTQMGWVYSAFLIVYTIAMIPGGWLIDRIGAARSMTLLGLTMGLFVVLTGVLGWVAGTPHQFWIGLLIVRGLAGLGSAPLHPGAAHVVSDVVPATGRSTANSLVTAGAVLGVALSYPVFGKLIDAATWRWAFVICGFVMMGYALVWSRLVAPHLGHIVTAVHTGDSPFEHDHAHWRPLLKSRDLWLVTLSYVSYGYFQYLFFYWMQNYFKQVLHVPDEKSREAAFLITIAQGFGMVLGGLCTEFICRHWGLAAGRRIIMLACMGLSGVCALVAVMLTDATQVTLWLALAMGIEGMCESVYWTSVTEIGGKARGFAGAFMNAGGNVGGFISPVLSPYLAQHVGWPAAIGFACIVCAAGGIAWLWIGTSHARAVAQSP